MSSYLVSQIAAIREQIGDLQRGRVTHRLAQVITADAGASTFIASLPDGQTISGLTAPAQFLPQTGQWVRIRLEGATPIYEPAGISEDAVTGREIAGGSVVADHIFDGAVGSEKLADLAVITAKIDNLAVNDAKIGGLSVAKLTAGTMSATVTISGKFATALTGARTELNALGLQVRNSSETLTVDLNGTSNLLAGSFKTALTGRRIEMLSSGSTGRLSFYSPDGTHAHVESYTSSTGQETIRIQQPISGAGWDGWNGIQFQTNDRMYLSSGLLQTFYGGGGGGQKAFEVREASNYSAGGGAAPTSTLRLVLDTGRSGMYAPNGVLGFVAEPTALRMYVGDVSFEGSIDVLRHGIADTARRSPKLLFRSEPDGGGGFAGSQLKFTVQGDGSSPRLEVRNTDDSAFGVIAASAFTVSSSADGKEQIADLAGSALARVRQMRPRTYRRTGGRQTVEIGLVAEEAPAEVVVESGDAVDLYPLAVLNSGAIKEIDARLETLIKKLGVVL